MLTYCFFKGDCSNVVVVVVVVDVLKVIVDVGLLASSLFCIYAKSII